MPFNLTNTSCLPLTCLGFPHSRHCDWVEEEFQCECRFLAPLEKVDQVVLVSWVHPDSYMFQRREGLFNVERKAAAMVMGVQYFFL